MAHKYSAHREHHVEKHRVSHIAHGHKHRADGGSVHSDEAADRKLFKKMIAEHERKEMRAEGNKSKHRRDRVARAKGGKVGKKGHTKVNVNVIAGGHNPAVPPPPAAMLPPPPAGAAPPPPMPPGPPMAGLGGGPPGLGPMRAHGGKVHLKKHYRAKGGSVKSGPAWEEGLKHATKVQHSDGKGQTNTPANLNRGRPITFARGGAVEAPGMGRGMGPKLPGGVVAGESRLVQA